MVDASPGEFQTAIEKQRPILLDKASKQLTTEIRDKSITTRQIAEHYIRTANVWARNGLGVSSEMGIEETLRWAKEKGKNISVFYSGITGGIEKTGEGDRANIDALMEQGCDLIISIEPPAEKPLVSFAADAIAELTVMKKLQELSIQPEVIAWSYGGFERLQLHLAAYASLISDISYAINHRMLPIEKLIKDVGNSDKLAEMASAVEHALLKVKVERQNTSSLNLPPGELQNKRQPLWQDVFATGYDAFQYLKCLKNANFFVGGSPATASEITSPFPHPSRMDFAKPIYEKLFRKIQNEIISAAGRDEGNPVMEAILDARLAIGGIDVSMYLARFLKIGQARETPITDLADQKSDVHKITAACMKYALGDGLILYLGDPGRYLTDASGSAFSNMEAIMFGDYNVINVEVNLPPKKATEVQEPVAAHDEILKAIQGLKAIAAALKLGILEPYGVDVGTGFSGSYIPAGLEINGIGPRGETLRRPLYFNSRRMFEMDREDPNNPLLKIVKTASVKWMGIENIRKLQKTVRPRKNEVSFGEVVRAFINALLPPKPRRIPVPVSI